MPRGKPWECTGEQLGQIETMAGHGLTDAIIADVLGVGEATIQRHAGTKAALRRGRAQATAKIAKTLFNMAKSGKCPAATFFWMKCRARWRETGDDSNTKPEVPETLALE